MLNLVNLVSTLCVLQFLPISSLIFIHFSSNFHPVLPYQTQVIPGVSGCIRPPTPGRMAHPSGRPRPAWHRHRCQPRCRPSKAGAAMDGTGDSVSGDF